MHNTRPPSHPQVEIRPGILHRVDQPPRPGEQWKKPSGRLDVKPTRPASKPFEQITRDLAPILVQTEEAMRNILKKASTVHMPDKTVLLRAFAKVR